MARRKVAILGGGVGALTAAYELSRPGWEERFESITVYQVGWRLGGKGASGRGRHGRIEEHGLHVWFGSYENAFRIMRECYETLAGTAGHPFASVYEAFEPAGTFVVEEARPDGRWLPWLASFPQNDDLPGDPDDATPLPTIWEYLVRSLQLALAVLSSVGTGTDEEDGVVIGKGPAEPAPVRLRPAADRAGRGPSGGGLSARAVVQQRAARAVLVRALDLIDTLGDDVTNHWRDEHALLAELLESVLDLFKPLLREVAERSDEIRRLWYVGDVFVAIALGMLRSGVFSSPQGLDVLDGFDFVDWLVLSGADEESARCALVRTVCYDLPFAYRDGDPAQPSCSAACAVQGLFRLFFTYRGAIAWKMRAGMGDIVFAPLYKVLRDRGVRFQFFHKVEQLHLSPDRWSIDSIDVTRQVRLAEPHHAPDDTHLYRPLVEVKGMGCWPAHPLFDQIHNGDEIRAGNEDLESFWNHRADGGRITLRNGDDFDVVVLGISLGALPVICSELIEDEPAWKRMIQEMGTVRTQAFQLWLSVPMEELAPGLQYPFTLGGYVEPFDTCADMRQIIAWEDFPPDHPVRAIAYFCNAMPTPPVPPDELPSDTPELADAKVKASALRFLQGDILPLWPDASRRYPLDFRWELLVDPEGGHGQQRFDSQFWTANVNPSDLYVLSLPGSSRWRLDPRNSWYDNLVLAGDWTSCGLNVGCVEAAVMSGMLAANGVQGFPSVDSIVGYRHER